VIMPRRYDPSRIGTPPVKLAEGPGFWAGFEFFTFSRSRLRYGPQSLASGISIRW
jgi:hypothetical protein